MSESYRTVQSRESIYVRIDFDKRLVMTERKQFIELLAKELEFGDLHEGRYNKHGWGMGLSHVIKVRQFKPDRSGGSREKKLVITMDDGIVGGSTISPGDPIRGRFKLYGHVTKGLKSVLGRPVEIELDNAAASRIVNDLASMMLRAPNTGITPEVVNDDRSS